MIRKPFDPSVYLDPKEKKQNNTTSKVVPLQSSVKQLTTTQEDVEHIIRQIEARGVDIAPNYEDWLKVGFAFAEEFGEQGESYFHRVSRLYPNYDYKKCQRQYKECLKGRKSGSVTIGTFFHYAKTAGIQLRKQNKVIIGDLLKEKTKPIKEPTTEEELPQFSDAIFKELPEFFQETTKGAMAPKERDILLLGSLTTISGCLPNVYGIYDQLTVYPNLFLFVTAPASSGKGRVNLCKRLVAPIHNQKRDETNSEKVHYEVDLAAYYEQKKKDKTLQKPEKPLGKLLFIPANSSATGTFQLLANNEGNGLIFETEGDTLAQAFKSEYGNYSDGFRKAFHHESISYYRRTDSEYINIPNPRLSAVLTGTPNQILSLIPDAENGLFSRFIFYKMNRQKEWRNVFQRKENHQRLDHTFDRLGQQFLEYYHTLEIQPNKIEIFLNEEQSQEFHRYFSNQYNRFLFLEKEDLEASLMRLGLICFRIMMILTTMRMLESDTLTRNKECDPRDFYIAMEIIKTLLTHNEHVFHGLPKNKKILPLQKNRKERFLDTLPKEFTTRQYKELGEQLDIPYKTSQKYIAEYKAKGFLQSTSHGKYLHILKK